MLIGKPYPNPNSNPSPKYDTIVLGNQSIIKKANDPFIQVLQQLSQKIVIEVRN